MTGKEGEWSIRFFALVSVSLLREGIHFVFADASEVTRDRERENHGHREKGKRKRGKDTEEEEMEEGQKEMQKEWHSCFRSLGSSIVGTSCVSKQTRGLKNE